MKHDAHIDLFRGVLIALMITVHIVHFGDLYPSVKAGILAFMMPAFLIITGYLVNVRKSVAAFGGYLLRLLVPYVLFVTAFALLSLYLPVRDGLGEFTWEGLAEVLLVRAIGPYWFLHTMIVCGALYYIAFRLGATKTAGYALFAALLLLVALHTPLLNIKAAVYYFIGAGVRVYVGDFSKIYAKSLWAALPFGLLLSDARFYDWGSISVLLCALCFFSLSAGIACRFPLSRQGGAGRWAWVEYIGRNTLPIYLLHPVFTMLSKYYLSLFAFDGTGVLHALFTVALALGGSLLIARAMDRCHLSWALGRKRLLR